MQTFLNCANAKEIYMQWRNLQQVSERVEIYYERLLKLVNYLQVKATDVFLTLLFSYQICNRTLN